MKHIFINNNSSKTIILLHGTGGNEHDLLNVGKFIDPKSNLLGIRGNVLEQGMPRFFKRLAMGVLDTDNLKIETNNLIDFIEKAIVDYKIKRENILILGYSNGANIMASMLYNSRFNYPKLALLHPMRPFGHLKMPSQNTKIFLTYGKLDQMIPEKEALSLIDLIKDANIDLTVYPSPFGHELKVEALEALKTWI